jgi:hypothetical protein
MPSLAWVLMGMSPEERSAWCRGDVVCGRESAALVAREDKAGDDASQSVTPRARGPEQEAPGARED